MIFDTLTAKVTAAVQGVTIAEAEAALKAQSAIRGEALDGDGALNLRPVMGICVADAALVNAPQSLTAKNQREGDFCVASYNSTLTTGALNPYTLTVS